MKKVLAALLLAGAAYVPAAAAAPPSGASMLAPGIYTTADISRRCQTYTNRRVSSSGVADTSRQGVFLACVQKLYGQEYGGAGPAEVAGAPLVEAPVALPGYSYGYGSGDGAYGYGCSTDEGYGRRGSCSTF